MNSKQNNTSKTDPHDPNVGTADPTDGRGIYEWKSRYEGCAVWIIRFESLYLTILLVVAFLGIFLTWNRWLETILLSGDVIDAHVFRVYSYYFFSGLLGGVTFSIKYMYRVVARGYWHMDRQIWRILSPFMSISVSFALGSLFSAGFISTGNNDVSAPSSVIAVGFLAGYFADQAIGKMYEVAMVLFGPAQDRNKH